MEGSDPERLRQRIVELEAQVKKRPKEGQTTEAAREFAEHIVETVREPLLVLDSTLRVLYANAYFYRVFQVDPINTCGRLLYELGDKQWDIPELKQLLEDILPQNNPFRDFEVEHEFPNLGRKTMVLNARRLDGVQMILLAIEDVTARKRAEKELAEYREHLEELVRERTGELEDTSEKLGSEVSTRKKAEESLKEYEGLYRTIFENTGTAKVITDDDTTILLANAEAVKLYGYSREELEGKRSWTDFVHPDDLEKVMGYHHLRRLDSAAVPKGYEYRMLNRNGEIRYLSVFAELIPGTRRSVASLVDITEHKRVEEALRDEKAFTERVLNILTDVFFVFDLDGKFLRWNKALSDVTGYSDEEISRMAPTDFVFAGDAQRALNGIDIVKNMGWVTREVSVRTKDGRHIPYDFAGSLFYDVEKSPMGICGIGRDVTERKRYEERLRESEETYRKLVDTSPDAIAAGDLHGRITFVSKEALKLYGFEGPDEMLGKFFFDFIAPEDHERALTDFQRTLSEGETRNAEYTLLRKDGFRVCGELSSALLRDATGEPTGFIGVVKDLTERKRAQERIEKLTRCFLGLGAEPFASIEKILQCGWDILGGTFVAYSRMQEGKIFILSTLQGEEVFLVAVDPEIHIGYEVIQGRENAPLALDLEGSVYEESDPLIQKFGIRSFLGHPLKGKGCIGCIGLYDTNKRGFTSEDIHIMGMLARGIAIEEERLAREENLKEFIDIAAHELRHPVTILKGYALLLRESDAKMDDGTKQHCLKAIDEGAERLNKLTGELLDSSRIERGRFSIEKQEIALEPLIKLVVDDIPKRGEGNEFHISVSKDIGMINADPEKLRELIVILLDNAILNSPPGSDIGITAEMNDDEVVISILDRGRGIPEEHCEMVFERFYQVGDVNHHSIPGIGLGLYIARQIAVNHGGRIWYEPRPGGGSVFTFTLAA